MATAHHDLSEQMVQQILSSTPPLAEQIRQDPENKEYTELGWEPVYSASPKARIVVIGQAPGRAAQESRIPWNDPSGEKRQVVVSDTRTCAVCQRRLGDAVLAVLPGSGRTLHYSCARGGLL